MQENRPCCEGGDARSGRGSLTGAIEAASLRTIPSAPTSCRSPMISWVKSCAMSSSIRSDMRWACATTSRAIHRSVARSGLDREVEYLRIHRGLCPLQLCGPAWRQGVAHAPVRSICLFCDRVGHETIALDMSCDDEWPVLDGMLARQVDESMLRFGGRLFCVVRLGI